MARFNYSSSAELFPGRNRARKSPLAYHRFDTAAEALRYAMEELPATLLNGALLEVDEQRYSWAQMQALYDSPEYPLERERELAMAS